MFRFTKKCKPKPEDGHIREVVEIQIPIPYGHLSAKWWGRRDVRPILCVHGWQDNAGTFDTLIPLLPDHVGYLAIDMPGHGMSSRMPSGLVYTAADFMYILNYVIRQFGWPKVSLLGHSMGAIMSFNYAAAFPELIDMVIALDGLQGAILKPGHTGYLQRTLDHTHTADLRNQAGTEPPSYTYEELVERMNAQTFLSVSRSSALYLLARGVSESVTQPGRYYFTRDNRLKSFAFAAFTPDILLSMAQNISCPFLYVRALHSPTWDTPEAQNAILDVMMAKPDFSMHIADGGHHVHLNEPEKVSGPVTEFLLKYESRRTIDPAIPAKL